MSDDAGDFESIGPRARDVAWNIQLTGRQWDDHEFDGRADMRPEKLEIWDGKLLFDDNERLLLAGLLIENLGAAQVVRLGDPNVWRAAVETLR